MSSHIRLAPVTSKDIPHLGYISAIALAPNPLWRFIFQHGTDLDLSIQSSRARYQNDYANPTTRFMKAIDGTTGEIVGFITWTMVEKQQEEQAWRFDPPMNEDYNKAVFGSLQTRRVRSMWGKKYIRTPPFSTK